MHLKLKQTLPPDKEVYLTLYFTLQRSVRWAAAGHVVATGQIRLSLAKSVANLLGLTGPAQLKPPLLLNHCKRPAIEVAQPFPHVLHITANTPNRTAWVFDLFQGHLTSWKRNQDSTNTLATPLKFDLYRALTNNDAGGDSPNGVPGSQGRQWRDALVHLAREHPSLQDGQSSKWEEKTVPDGTDIVEITVTSRIAPAALGWGIDVTSTYRFMAKNSNTTLTSAANGEHDGESLPCLHLHVRAKASGPWLPPNFPRFGLVTSLRQCHSAKWFGRGPGESYRDKKESQLIGTYTRAIAPDLFTNYEVPQENGNRTDVRWVEFRGQEAGTGLTDDEDGGLGAGHGKPYRLLRARFGDLDGASFSAREYTTRELDVARHPFELDGLARARRKEQGDVVEVHLDFVHHGLGTGSCGPETLPQYSLSQKEFDFEIILD